MDPAPLRVETVTPCRYSAAAFVTFNRTPSSAEVLALHRLLVHYVNQPTVPCVAQGGGEV